MAIVISVGCVVSVETCISDGPLSMPSSLSMLAPLLRGSLFIATVGVISTLIANAVMWLDLNNRTYNFVPGECSSVTLKEDSPSPTAFSSWGEFVVISHVYEETGKGGIFVYHAKNKSAHEISIKSTQLKFFFPINIAMHDKRLFVVNEKRGSPPTVELFDMDLGKNTATHISTIRSKKFDGLRHLTALSKKSFYATVWKEDESLVKSAIQQMVGWDKGAVVYFDGANSKYVNREVHSPTGITFDKVYNKLYVSSFGEENIQLFNVHKNHSITKEKSLPVGVPPLSLWLGADHSLVTSTAPLRLRTLLHRLGFSDHSPSLVLRVHTNVFMTEPRVDALYANDGATISAVSAGVVSGGALLMAARNSSAITCPLPAYITFNLDF